MGSIPPELSLEVRPTFIPKTISDFLGGLTTIGSVSERLSRLDEFVKRLEEEMRKIDAFKRELPLCMLLLKDAIVTLREESMQCRTRNVQPVLEEFIPLKKNCDDSEKSKAEKEEDNREKKNWMSSVQLWNTDGCKNIDSNDDSKQKSVAKFIKGSEEECSSVADDPFQSIISRAEPKSFVPFKGCSVFPAMVSRKEEKSDLPVAGLSLLTPGIKNPREEIGSSGMSSKTSGSRAVSSSALNGQSNLRAGPQPLQQQAARKQRRCWSPELHRRFVNALQQLGGPQVATPKQIRELMQVDGLTNDEVKSHLQKFRLHTRRVPASTATPANEDMVILGGLWMPHDRYVESSKQNSTQSGSPQGPLQLAGTGGGTSTTEGDSMEEEEDEKSESYSWKSQTRKSGKDAI